MYDKVGLGQWSVSRNNESKLVLAMPLKEKLHSFTIPFPWTRMQTRRGTILDCVEEECNILKTEEKE